MKRNKTGIKTYKIHNIHFTTLPLSGARAYVGFIKRNGEKLPVASMDRSPGSWWSLNW